MSGWQGSVRNYYPPRARRASAGVLNPTIAWHSSCQCCGEHRICRADLSAPYRPLPAGHGQNPSKINETLRLCSGFTAWGPSKCSEPHGKSSHDTSRPPAWGSLGNRQNPTWGSSWALLGQPGRKLVLLGCILDPFGLILRPTWLSKTTPKGPRYRFY